jgi:hypothetical protein
LNLSATPATPAAVVSNDDKQPYTDGWSVNVDQQTPWQGLLEIGYVGNRSRDQLNNGGAGGAGSDINLVPFGAMFTATNPGSANGDSYRPYQGYSNLKFANNDLYQNYNAMQVSWIRHAGLYTIQANYTWQKAMGIISPNIEPFNLSANYGALPVNRGQLFNVAYSIDLGNRLHVNRLVDGVGNGWQISGVTQLESGANLTYGGNGFGGNAINGNYNVTYTCPDKACPQSTAIIPGSISTANPNGIAINNQSILGTPDQELHPYLTCNPRSHTGSHQFINGNCFAAPTVVGQNGPTLLPAVYGPAFFDSDLGLFKNFAIREGMKLQLRAQAYNFLNHPLYSFPSGSSNLNLVFTQDPKSQVITQTNTNFGYTTQKQGARIMEFGAKFYF